MLELRCWFIFLSFLCGISFKGETWSLDKYWFTTEGEILSGFVIDWLEVVHVSASFDTHVWPFIAYVAWIWAIIWCRWRQRCFIVCNKWGYLSPLVTQPWQPVIYKLFLVYKLEFKPFSINIFFVFTYIHRVVIFDVFALFRHQGASAV